MHNFFLNNKKLTFITKSISFLHPIRILNNAQNKPAIYNKNIFFIISKIICRYYFFYKDILLDLIFKKKDKLKHSKIIIISHFLKKEYLNNKGDFYFGKLPTILKNKNITYFRFLINHTKFNSSYFLIPNTSVYALLKFLLSSIVDISAIDVILSASKKKNLAISLGNKKS